MQLHTIYGANIMNSMQLKVGPKMLVLKMAKDIALHHHQYWNGMGYPRIKDLNGNILDDDYLKKSNHNFGKCLSKVIFN